MADDWFTDADVERAAEAIYDHDPDRIGLCDHHAGWCCPSGDAHSQHGGAYAHQARAVLASLTPDAMLAALVRAGTLTEDDDYLCSGPDALRKTRLVTEWEDAE